jgi:hypothetical protein
MNIMAQVCTRKRWTSARGLAQNNPYKNSFCSLSP